MKTVHNAYNISFFLNDTQYFSLLLLILFRGQTFEKSYIFTLCQKQ